jgi:hypothetical protein
VDGEGKLILRANDAVSVTVGAGRQVVECVSTEVSEARAREVLDLREGGKELLSLRLLGAVKEARPLRECARGFPRTEMAAVRNGVLRQCGTMLEWQQADNGVDLDWNNARGYCSSLSGGWQLPTVEQLVSISDPRVPEVACGDRVYSSSGYWGSEGERIACRVSSLFRLGNAAFWSSERLAADSSRARVARLDGSYPRDFSNSISDATYVRALCVRQL